MAKNLTDSAVLHLEEEIINGVLLPRERLTEISISSRLDISRAPVREALRILENDGLIERAGQGFIVSDITIDEAQDIFEVIAFTEDLYTRRATEHVSEANILKLKELVREMEVIAEEGNAEMYPAINNAFHDIIQEACPNKSLIRLVISVGKRTMRYRHFASRLPGHLRQSVVDHARIVDAIAAHDPVAAGKAARKAAIETFRRVKKALLVVGRL